MKSGPCFSALRLQLWAVTSFPEDVAGGSGLRFRASPVPRFFFNQLGVRPQTPQSGIPGEDEGDWDCFEEETRTGEANADFRVNRCSASRAPPFDGTSQVVTESIPEGVPRPSGCWDSEVEGQVFGEPQSHVQMWAGSSPALSSLGLCLTVSPPESDR